MAEVERDVATGRRRPLEKDREEREAAAPSLTETGAAAGEAAANLQTAAALHAMARTLPTASTGEGVGTVGLLGILSRSIWVGTIASPPVLILVVVTMTTDKVTSAEAFACSSAAYSGYASSLLPTWHYTL